MAINPHERFSDVLSRFFAEWDSTPQSDRGPVMEKWRPILKEWEPLMARQSEMLDFFNLLVNRQGTVPPDFEELYQKKAELDRKLFGPS
jgi:hypothetical protein